MKKSELYEIIAGLDENLLDEAYEADRIDPKTVAAKRFLSITALALCVVFIVALLVSAVLINNHIGGRSPDGNEVLLGDNTPPSGPYYTDKPSSEVSTARPTELRTENDPFATPQPPETSVGEVLVIRDGDGNTVKPLVCLLYMASYKEEMNALLYSDACPVDLKTLSELKPSVNKKTDYRLFLGDSSSISSVEVYDVQKINESSTPEDFRVDIPVDSSAVDPGDLVKLILEEDSIPEDFILAITVRTTGRYIAEIGENEYAGYLCCFRFKTNIVPGEETVGTEKPGTPPDVDSVPKADQSDVGKTVTLRLGSETKFFCYTFNAVTSKEILTVMSDVDPKAQTARITVYSVKTGGSESFFDCIGGTIEATVISVTNISDYESNYFYNSCLLNNMTDTNEIIDASKPWDNPHEEQFYISVIDKNGGFAGVRGNIKEKSSTSLENAAIVMDRLSARYGFEYK